jgi:multiple sugar transport system substrate-binding protein
MISKKLSRRDFLRVGALAAAGAALASCAPGAAEPAEPEQVEVTVIVEKEGETVVVTATPPPAERPHVHFSTSYAIEIYDPLLYEQVAEHHPEIDLEVSTTPFATDGGWETYGDNMITRIAGGEGIDVIYAPTEVLPLFSVKNVITSLDPYIEADPAVMQDMQDDIHPTLIEGTQWRGEQMGMPNGYNNMIIHYNPVIFEEKGAPMPTADWTWDDFVESCLAIADVKGTEEDLFAYSFWGTSTFGMCPWYFNNDTSMFTDDWLSSNMDDPKVAETLQFLGDLVLVHKVSPNPAGWDEWAQFHSGHQAMRTCGGWCINGAKNDEFYDFALQYQPHNSGPLKTNIGIGAYCLATITDVPGAAWDVINVLNNYAMQLSWVVVDGAPPSRKSVAQSDEFMSLAEPSPYADMSIMWESLDYAKVIPAPPNFNLTEPILVRYYSQIWNGEITVEEAVTAAHEELTLEMDKMKTDLGL